MRKTKADVVFQLNQLRAVDRRYSVRIVKLVGVTEYRIYLAHKELARCTVGEAVFWLRVLRQVAYTSLHGIVAVIENGVLQESYGGESMVLIDRDRWQEGGDLLLDDVTQLMRVLGIPDGAAEVQRMDDAALWAYAEELLSEVRKRHKEIHDGTDHQTTVGE